MSSDATMRVWVSTKSSHGFTLAELLVSIAIIVIVTGAMLVQWRGGSRTTILRRQAQIIVLDLRRAQNLALAATSFQGSVPNGYGIFFTMSQPDRYILFADTNSNQLYDSAEAVETIVLERATTIFSLRNATGDTPSVNTLTVFFCPPNPNTYIRTDTDIPGSGCAGGSPQAMGRVILENTGGSSSSEMRRVRVTTSGLVGIE